MLVCRRVSNIVIIDTVMRPPCFMFHFEFASINKVAAEVVFSIFRVFMLSFWVPLLSSHRVSVRPKFGWVYLQPPPPPAEARLGGGGRGFQDFIFGVHHIGAYFKRCLLAKLLDASLRPSTSRQVWKCKHWNGGHCRATVLNCWWQYHRHADVLKLPFHSNLDGI